MLFLFRTIGFWALGAILLSSFWSFDHRLEQKLFASVIGGKYGTVVRPAYVVAATDFPYSVTAALQGPKTEIHDDMCRHSGSYHLTSPNCRDGASSEATPAQAQE